MGIRNISSASFYMAPAILIGMRTTMVRRTMSTEKTSPIQVISAPRAAFFQEILKPQTVQRMRQHARACRRSLIVPACQRKDRIVCVDLDGAFSFLQHRLSHATQRSCKPRPYQRHCTSPKHETGQHCQHRPTPFVLRLRKRKRLRDG